MSLMELYATISTYSRPVMQMMLTLPLTSGCLYCIHGSKLVLQYIITKDDPVGYS